MKEDKDLIELFNNDDERKKPPIERLSLKGKNRKEKIEEIAAVIRYMLKKEE